MAEEMVNVRRWIAEPLGVSIQVEWINEEGMVVATAGTEPPPGTEFLTDEEFIEVQVDLDASSKVVWDQTEAEARQASIVARSEADDDRAALVTAGIPADVAERMVVAPAIYDPVPYTRRAGWELWLKETFCLDEWIVEEIRSRLDGGG